MQKKCKKYFIPYGFRLRARGRYEAREEHDGIYRARIPEEIFEEFFELEYVIKVSDGAREFTLGSVLPLRVPVYDNRGPRITSMIPTRGYAYDGRKPVDAEEKIKRKEI